MNDFVNAADDRRAGDEILLIDRKDGDAPRDRLVVTDRHAGQPRFDGADHVPSRRQEMDDVAQRRDGDRAMRIIREQRLARRRAASAHHPVVAALRHFDADAL